MHQFFKKLAGLVLSLAIIGGAALALPALRAHADSAVTVYFHNTLGWSSVYCYTFQGSSDTGTAWPGDAMTDLGNGWFQATYTGSAALNVVFNDNNDNQTGNNATTDLPLAQGVYYFAPNGNGDTNPISHKTTYAIDTFTSAADAGFGVTIYFKNTLNWSAVYCYTFHGSSDTGTAWPGDQMTDLGNGWTKMLYTGTQPLNVTFNDNKNDQTGNTAPSDLALTQSAYYFVPNGKTTAGTFGKLSYDIDTFQTADDAGYPTVPSQPSTPSEPVSTPVSTPDSSKEPSSSPAPSASATTSSTVSSTASAANPKTGDTGSPYAAGAVAVVSFAAVCVLLMKRKIGH